MKKSKHSNKNLFKTAHAPVQLLSWQRCVRLRKLSGQCPARTVKFRAPSGLLSWITRVGRSRFDPKPKPSIPFWRLQMREHNSRKQVSKFIRYLKGKAGKRSSDIKIQTTQVQGTSVKSIIHVRNERIHVLMLCCRQPCSVEQGRYSA